MIHRGHNGPCPASYADQTFLSEDADGTVGRRWRNLFVGRDSLDTGQQHARQEDVTLDLGPIFCRNSQVRPALKILLAGLGDLPKFGDGEPSHWRATRREFETLKWPR